MCKRASEPDSEWARERDTRAYCSSTELRATVPTPNPPESLLDQASVFKLEVEELLQGVGTLAVLAVGGVVLAAVGDDALQVCDEEFLGHVVSVLQPLRHGLQI